MQSWKSLFFPLLAASLCFAAQPDRITAPIDSSRMVALTGNVHGLARPRFDLGRTDGSQSLQGLTLAFRPSTAQQQDLDNFLVQLQDRSSPNYHKWLTPAQFADRFGMTRNDISRVTTWLESEGFAVTSVANSRNQISFDGTVAQVESVFRTEIHNYLVDSVIHFANANNPSVPVALAGSVLAVGHLNDFRPKARAIHPHFTSDQSGNHFLSPGDFATIYQLQSLYTAGIDGTGQTIAVVGQTAIITSDLDNFRSAAGLTPKEPTQVLVPLSGTSVVSSGDLVEADLDLEWSNGVAKNATVIYVYVGNNPSFSVWDSLQYAVDNNSAPVISTSYGFCESGLPSGFPQEVRGWAQQANTQGQTIAAASGDSGAADCDDGASGTMGLAVDVPASIPEVTGMGGNEFFGDAASTSNTQYWLGSSTADIISSAIMYIPEMAWNDTTFDIENGGGLAASGGGASIYFTKLEAPWQAGTGVPADGKRDVPDLALAASPNHDGYLFCNQLDPDGNLSCSSGFRDSQGFLDVVGGTSAAAPTFAGIVALLNQYLVTNGFLTKPGLGNANPNLYYIAENNPTAMNDVTTGNNIVPCTEGTLSCPATAPFQYGFSTGVGYDQVTGLGSVNGNALAVAWGELSTATTTSISPSATSISIGNPVTFTATVTPASATGTVSFYDNGSTTALGTATVSGGTATFITSSLPSGTNAVVGTYRGINAQSTSSAVTVTVSAPFTMSANPSTLTVSAGQTTASTITLTPVNGFNGAVSFTNSTTSNPGSCTSGLPAGALCTFSKPSVAPPGTVVLTITTPANMTIPVGAQTLTVTGTSGSSAVPITLNLTVTTTNQSFTFASPTPESTFPVAVGGSTQVNITVTGTGSPVSFVTNSTTALPLTYTCVGVPPLPTAEISCVLPSQGQPTNSTAVSVSLVTTAPTAQLLRPLSRASRIFYALLLPGLFGFVFVAGSRTRGLRLLSLIVLLGFSTVWLGSCGGNNGGTGGVKNPGTPAGLYQVTITATTGGANPLSSSVGITLNVTGP
jgi:hypothetical protein